jgi:pullulanase
MPGGWQTLDKPPLSAPEDIVLYELHIRDFSWYDEDVTPDYQGRYLAFTETESAGMQHLQALADAGLTHVHLLPSFDITTIPEWRHEQVEFDTELLASFPPDSDQQQAIIQADDDQDGFNWGYDPYHYSVPEGSYATNPDGPARILEYRAMVQALNEAGLRVVADVVYNHTSAAGQNPRSVLDRIVPGYYHRLNANGALETSTCCANTATEHNMMQKLMLDSLVTWATVYKIDGFRFDLMGHHMLEDMIAARDTLQGLTLAGDGVDGDAPSTSTARAGTSAKSPTTPAGSMPPNSTSPARASAALTTASATACAAAARSAACRNKALPPAFTRTPMTRTRAARRRS